MKATICLAKECVYTLDRLNDQVALSIVF